MSETSFGYHFKWANRDGETTVSAEGFADPAERDAAFKRALVTFGYESPRWWQWWRWGEPRPRAEP